jgi:serine protease Do
VGTRANAWVVPRIEAPDTWEVAGGAGQQILGLRWVDVPEDLRTAWGAPREAGVVVARVMAEGPAAKAGVKVGDVVVRVNGVAMSSVQAVPYLSSAAAIPLEIVRRGSPKPLTLSLEPTPAASPAPARPAAKRVLEDAERRRLEAEIERLRAEVTRLSEELKRERSAR